MTTRMKAKGYVITITDTPDGFYWSAERAGGTFYCGRADSSAEAKRRVERWLEHQDDPRSAAEKITDFVEQ